MIKSLNEQYLLSPILDHKTKVDIAGIEILISKDWENNLRLRNCQMGIVEAIPEENPLRLSVGDIVFTHHFVFNLDIGRNRSFIFRPHVEVDGKKIFRADPRTIFLKLEGDEITQLGDVIVLAPVPYNEQASTFDLVGHFKDRGRIIYPTEGYEVGDVVLVEKNALYPLDLRGKNVFKIYRGEIVGKITGEEVLPAPGRVLLVDEEEYLQSDFLDLSEVQAQGSVVKAEILKVGDMKGICANEFKAGDKILRGRNYGIRFNNQFLVAVVNGNILGILA